MNDNPMRGIITGTALSVGLFWLPLAFVLSRIS